LSDTCICPKLRPLKSAFSKVGAVESVELAKKEDGRSKGFGFITLMNDEDAVKAMDALNNSEQMGRNIAVKEALPKPDRMM
jgi:RNA recognition motif-containing protein